MPFLLVLSCARSYSFGLEVLPAFQLVAALKGDLKGLVDIIPLSYKGDNLMTTSLCSNTPDLFWKGIYSERKELAPKGSKCYLFRVDPLSQGRQNLLASAPLLNAYQSPLRERFTEANSFLS